MILSANPEAPGFAVLSAGGAYLGLCAKDARDLALAIANRATGRATTPSPVARLELSATKDALSAALFPEETPRGWSVRTIARSSAEAWIGLATALYAVGAAKPDATLDDVFDYEFGNVDPASFPDASGVEA